MKKWLDANKLALNVDKTNFIIFHSHAKKLTEPIALKFGCKKISQADHVRFLGVLLDVKRFHKLIMSDFLGFSLMRLLVGSLTLLNCPGNLPGQLEFSTN